MPAALPEVFGRYRILKKLGEGGMGAVYLAEDTRLDRHVAIKVPRFASHTDSQVIERFYREARLAARLTHHNLCPVHDVDCQDGVHYLSMAYIEGTSLAEQIDPDNPWPPAQAVLLVRQVADVLGLLHSQGIIHRDLKPANVMIRPDGSPVLMDFGLARSVSAQSQPLTVEGRMLGTPSYMAPEQVAGERDNLGPATDVWALGVLLYQLLTGDLPFRGTVVELGMQILHATPPRPSSLRPGIPTSLDDACLKALTKEVGRRPADMQAFTALLPVEGGNEHGTQRVAQRHVRRTSLAQTTGRDRGDGPLAGAGRGVSESFASTVRPGRPDRDESPRCRPGRRGPAAIPVRRGGAGAAPSGWQRQASSTP